mmetsp:Transcript_29511/g.70072  ORF Transcript_29511/g.70072 Transcript_29511/m.70072 type:complete len:221 (+) Transcript_29511:850-1512(+)
MAALYCPGGGPSAQLACSSERRRLSSTSESRRPVRFVMEKRSCGVVGVEAKGLGSASAVHHHRSSNRRIIRKILSKATLPTLRLPSAPMMSGVSPVTSASQLGTALLGKATRIVSSIASSFHSGRWRKERNCVYCEPAGSPPITIWTTRVLELGTGLGRELAELRGKSHPSHSTELPDRYSHSGALRSAVVSNARLGQYMGRLELRSMASSCSRSKWRDW